jgi:hypothetical protein
VLVPLRPSNAPILIVCIPGAREEHGCHSLPCIVGALRAQRPYQLWRPPILRLREHRRSSGSIPACLFREQEGDQAAYPLLGVATAETAP